MTQPLDDEGFHSIAWDDAPANSQPAAERSPAHSPFSEGFESISPSSVQPQSSLEHDDYGIGTEDTITLERKERHAGKGVDGKEWNGRWMCIEVREPAKEHEGNKDTYISYAVRTETTLQTFIRPKTGVRRRFQDFVFLHDHLAKAFPACIIPPIPDKHRLEYIKGDRFSTEFVEKRRQDLQRFADRISRHPTLQRSKLVGDFLQSTEWTVAKHHHIAHPPPESQNSLIDSLSDTFINAFSKVRKPDARFVEMIDELERFEEGLTSVQRVNHTTTEPFLAASHSLLAYSAAHRATIKSRDQKHLDFEELSAYLSAVVSERDRLAALSSGHTAAPVGLGTYLRDQVDKIRGTDDIHTRRERMRKLDVKINELQEAVTIAHETSNAFSEEVIKEHVWYELEKREEMKEALQGYVDGQVEMFKTAMDDWDRVIPILQRIRVDV
nr:sorting nexin-4 [Cryptococcus depauperatus CBS 7855]